MRLLRVLRRAEALDGAGRFNVYRADSAPHEDIDGANFGTLWGLTHQLSLALTPTRLWVDVFDLDAPWTSKKRGSFRSSHHVVGPHGYLAVPAGRVDDEPRYGDA